MEKMVQYGISQSEDCATVDDTISFLGLMRTIIISNGFYGTPPIAIIHESRIREIIRREFGSEMTMCGSSTFLGFECVSATNIPEERVAVYAFQNIVKGE